MGEMHKVFVEHTWATRLKSRPVSVCPIWVSWVNKSSRAQLTFALDSTLQSALARHQSPSFSPLSASLTTTINFPRPFVGLLIVAFVVRVIMLRVCKFCTGKKSMSWKNLNLTLCTHVARKNKNSLSPVSGMWTESRLSIHPHIRWLLTWSVIVDWRWEEIGFWTVSLKRRRCRFTVLTLWRLRLQIHVVLTAGW